jgi:UDP-N-acetylglucosamine--N-acetylmuramyl-(pentapeptide) pyrophosphoryl-undecaprenol N-acetylglucosamine transferase
LKLLIAGGGTGGHVIPAIAVAREWLRRDETRDVVFVGTQRGIESRLVPEAGLKLELIRSAGLKGMGTAQFIHNILLLRLAFWDSAAILGRHHFAAAFGVGGYAAGPVMLSAIISGLPSVIFEPNAEAGFTNRVLADMATRIAAGFPSVAERLGRRVLRFSAAAFRAALSHSDYRWKPRLARCEPCRHRCSENSLFRKQALENRSSNRRA